METFFLYLSFFGQERLPFCTKIRVPWNYKSSFFSSCFEVLSSFNISIFQLSSFKNDNILEFHSKIAPEPQCVGPKKRRVVCPNGSKIRKSLATSSYKVTLPWGNWLLSAFTGTLLGGFTRLTVS